MLDVDPDGDDAQIFYAYVLCSINHTMMTRQIVCCLCCVTLLLEGSLVGLLECPPPVRVP